MALWVMSSMFNIAETLLAVLLTLSLYLIFILAAVIVFRLLFHPLAQVPGPRLAAITNAWQAYHVRNGRMFDLGRSLHKKYGPIVRVGPNEIWFDSQEAFRAIYQSEYSLTDTTLSVSDLTISCRQRDWI